MMAAARVGIVREAKLVTAEVCISGVFLPR